MTLYQPGILEAVPAVGRYLTFQLVPDDNPTDELSCLSEMVTGTDMVIGIGPATLSRIGRRIDGLREPPCFTGCGISVPATPAALWCWLRGSDRGELVHRSHALVDLLARGFMLDGVIDSFVYAGGRDLSGYEDGTENPKGDDALAAGFVSDCGPGINGSSFVAVQKWQHDLGRLARFTPDERDATIGRRQSDNKELEDAPESAHVKRTAQESFTPEAFLLRRSMPWADPCGEGLVFVAFASSFHPFEAQLQRMMGLGDGIPDALFRFTRPLSTSYFWCPPVLESKLDLRALAL